MRVRVRLVCPDLPTKNTKKYKGRLGVNPGVSIRAIRVIRCCEKMLRFGLMTSDFGLLRLLRQYDIRHPNLFQLIQYIYHVSIDGIVMHLNNNRAIRFLPDMRFDNTLDFRQIA